MIAVPQYPISVSRHGEAISSTEDGSERGDRIIQLDENNNDKSLGQVSSTALFFLALSFPMPRGCAWYVVNAN